MKIVKVSKLSPSWIFNQIMKEKRKQFLTADDTDLLSFFKIIDQGNLNMPDSTSALDWIKNYLNSDIEDLAEQTGKRAEWKRQRCKYIISLIDTYQIKK